MESRKSIVDFLKWRSVLLLMSWLLTSASWMCQSGSSANVDHIRYFALAGSLQVLFVLVLSRLSGLSSINRLTAGQLTALDTSWGAAAYAHSSRYAKVRTAKVDRTL